MKLEVSGVSRKTMPFQVVDAIKLALRDGRLHIGDKLPSESELAEMLGVGHSSLREGVKILVAYGVLEVRQGEGTFVVDQFVENIFDFIGLNPEDDNYRSLLEMRRILECNGARLACGKATPAECAEMTRLANALDETADTETNIQLDAQFHDLLIGCAHNPFLTEFYHMIKKMSLSLMNRLMCYPEVVSDARTAHLKIAEALQNAGAEVCCAEVDAHLATVQQHRHRFLD